ncbi:MAG: NAD(P)/FAD-dependent oxidoreductase [Agathobacter sp.]|nr:NAD(P)/FAD-dependent oxidoreductase [Agathobacter sp.]
MRYDCIIIGSGPAGLSAAINLKTYNKNFLWFGNANLSEKVEKAEKVNNYPGLYGVSGKELAEAFLKHKEAMGIDITDKIVSSIYDMDGYYNVMAENQFYETDTIILAMGVVAASQYKGETEFVGRGVSYCATCDGALYKGKKIAVIATSKRFEHEVKFLAELAEQVYLFPFYKDCEITGDNITFVKTAPKEITGGFRVERLELANGDVLEMDGIFIMRSSIAPTTLLTGLQMEDGHIAVNRKQETNLSGVYAIGDCTGKPYQYAKAVGEGNVAAHSVIEYLGER